MKLTNNSFLFTLLLIMSYNGFAQKQTFDVVSYTMPKGWQQQQNDGGVQLSVTDKRTGAYAIAIITKAAASDASANENFNSDWNRLVKGSVQVNAEPDMQQPTSENGWEIISGTANYTDGAQKGVATLLTATGGRQMTSVVLMTNTDKYQNELLSFINSLELAETSHKETSNTKVPTTQTGNNASIVGLWVNYTTETSGYSNGIPQLSGGYFRKEYTFYDDGTYLFRMKNWAVYVKEIQFVYESGTWKLNGNELTITPKQGKGGWWSKSANNRTSEWGSLVKTGSWKMEPVTYTVDLNFYIGGSEKKITLQSNATTEREGKQDNNKIILDAREMGKSLIDNPPGLQTGFEKKTLNSSEIKKTNSSQVSTSKANKAIEGNWSYSASETQYGSLSPGYSTKQYSFKEDGTYIYQHKFFSSSLSVLLFQYESGNYSISGNQLTISPKIGANEEWSKDKTHPDKWGTRLKTSKRKLEKTTYTFTLQYFSGINETNLMLQAAKATEREGSFSSLPDYPNGWAFKPCNTNNNPTIVAPPGFKADGENKSTVTTANSINSAFAGKIWEAKSQEKYGAAYGDMSEFYTGGFWIYQYKFNTDGTYQFIYNAASALATNAVNVLQYETGTYIVSGSQLIITPLIGSNEEWSVGKVNGGMSAEHIRDVLETRLKRLKSTARKLEKITYPFTVEYWQGNNANALCLKHSQTTVREGSPGQNDQSCFFETTAAKAENFNSLFK